TEVGPLAVSSANRSGDAPIVSAEHAATSLGSDLLVIDAGPLSGVASAVVDLRDGFRLRRPGPLSEAELRAAWEPPTMSSTEGK
ncbi:MAG: L-threonylcarbamoyladenylate synthase, partial [Acidimicrobiales bacterium]